MVNKIKIIVYLVVKRIDLVTKFISILFIVALFTNHLHDYYYVNILDLGPLLPEIIQLLLQKFEFFLYWILPFLYGIWGCFFCFLIVSGIVERGTYYLQKKYSVNLGGVNTFGDFLFLQSSGLIIIVTAFGIFYMGNIYYILATVNHVGALISTDVYNSALDTINPIKGLLGFNILPVDITNTHKGWIEISLKINKYIVAGLCIYWVFIKPYVSVSYKKRRRYPPFNQLS